MKPFDQDLLARISQVPRAWHTLGELRAMYPAASEESVDEAIGRLLDAGALICHNGTGVPSQRRYALPGTDRSRAEQDAEQALLDQVLESLRHASSLTARELGERVAVPVAVASRALLQLYRRHLVVREADEHGGYRYRTLADPPARPLPPEPLARPLPPEPQAPSRPPFQLVPDQPSDELFVHVRGLAEAADAALQAHLQHGPVDPLLGALIDIARASWRACAMAGVVR